MFCTLCPTFLPLNLSSVVDVGYEEDDVEKGSCTPGPTTGPPTACYRSEARIPYWLSPRAGGPYVGLGRRRPASYQTVLTGGLGVAAVNGVQARGAARQRSSACAATSTLYWARSWQYRPPGLPAQYGNFMESSSPLYRRRNTTPDRCGPSPAAMVCARVEGLLGQRNWGKIGAYVTCRRLSLLCTGPAGFGLSYPGPCTRARDSSARADSLHQGWQGRWGRRPASRAPRLRTKSPPRAPFPRVPRGIARITIPRSLAQA